MEMTFLILLPGDIFTQGHARAKAHTLIKMFSSNWRNWTADGLVHHCYLGCGCENLNDTKVRAWAAILDVIFAARPIIPALSRWTKCCKTARFFVSGPEAFAGWLFMNLWTMRWLLVVHMNHESWIVGLRLLLFVFGWGLRLVYCC